MLHGLGHEGRWDGSKRDPQRSRRCWPLGDRFPATLCHEKPRDSPLEPGGCVRFTPTDFNHSEGLAISQLVATCAGIHSPMLGASRDDRGKTSLNKIVFLPARNDSFPVQPQDETTGQISKKTKTGPPLVRDRHITRPCRDQSIPVISLQFTELGTLDVKDLEVSVGVPEVVETRVSV
jgi:hypothetical protein